MCRSLLPALLLLSITAAPTQAQGPSTPPNSAPLLYVRFGGMNVARVTYYAGTPAGRELDAANVVGLRPGYIYRVKVSDDFADRARVALYPTLEVRGTLQLPTTLRAASYPASLVITPEDIEHALAGALITKVVYLEHPETARPVATRADLPLETSTRPSLDPLEEARNLGRPVLIMRLGGRTVSADELAVQGIPGTILFPGEKTLRLPTVRPWVPWTGLPVYDPIAGPRPPVEECLHDGGDAGRRAGLDNEGRLTGVDPADTVAVYTDSTGSRHVAVSNPVCICVPRFAVLRTTILPTGYVGSMTSERTKGLQGQALVAMRLPSQQTQQAVQLAATAGRLKPSGTENSMGTLRVSQLQGHAEVTGRMEERAVTGTLVQKTPVPADRPLCLTKWSDKQAAQVGEVVTFHLKFANQGGQPISDVVLTDSLTGRLEYVPGSAKADREHLFTMQENEAGSLLLRWQIVGRLQPGDSGEVSFQARIR